MVGDPKKVSTHRRDQQILLSAHLHLLICDPAFNHFVLCRLFFASSDFWSNLFGFLMHQRDVLRIPQKYLHTHQPPTQHRVFFDQSNGMPKANAQITPWLKIDWRLLWLDNFSSVDPSASSSHDENWNWTSQQQPNRLDTNKDEEEMTKCKQKPFDWIRIECLQNVRIYFRPFKLFVFIRMSNNELYILFFVRNHL